MMYDKNWQTGALMRLKTLLCLPIERGNDFFRTIGYNFA